MHPKNEANKLIGIEIHEKDIQFNSKHLGCPMVE